MSKIKPKVTLQLFKGEKCFGPGVCRLLEIVDEEKSLRKASQSMGMAYSKAWNIIKKAEDNLDIRLLDSTVGGKSGGGATLTKEAKKIINDYRLYEKELLDTSDKCFKKYFDWIG